MFFQRVNYPPNPGHAPNQNLFLVPNLNLWSRGELICKNVRSDNNFGLESKSTELKREII